MAVTEDKLAITGPWREPCGVEYWRCEHCNRESVVSENDILHKQGCPESED